MIRWDNKNAADDTFIHFDEDVSGNITGFSLHPFTVDFEANHTYSDMYFTPLLRDIGTHP